MESPVRIKLGVFFVILITLNVSHCFPQLDENDSLIEDTTTQESTTQSIYKQKANETLFKYQTRNNTWLYQKRNATTHSSIKTSTVSPIDTTINYGNKITFRGSVKYFATRPPFKPKVPYSKRNITKNEPSEKSEEKSKNVPKSFTPEIKSHYRSRIQAESTTISNSVIPSQTKDSSEENLKDSDRNDSSKSLRFNINKYTSPEFHNINNVYNQSISPEIEQFIMPDNEESSQSKNYYNKDLTTPISELFDKRFKEVSDSIKQNLADSEFSNEDRFKTEKFYESEASSGGINFDDLLSKGNDSDTNIVYKNSKEIVLTDSENSQSVHRDLTDINGTSIFYEMTRISTENYDQKPSTSKTIKKNKDAYETTTLSPLSSNEVINSLVRKNGNNTRNGDQYRSNGSRREFLSTIRMRAHTTPRPKIRILLKNNTRDVTTDSSKESYTTTRLPQIIKPHNYTRRKPLFNNTTTISPPKLDPVFQGDYSSTRILDYRKSQSDNSIPTLKKRGNLKYNEKLNNSNTSEAVKDEEVSSQFNLPPTAAAWALITLKHAPGSKKLNNSSTSSSPINPQNSEVRINTEDDLQKLDKVSDTTTDIRSESSQKRPLYEKVPTISTVNVSPKMNVSLSEENEDDNADEEENYDEKDDITNLTKSSSSDLKESSSKNAEKFDQFDQNVNKSSFKSITKLPGIFTTPMYDLDLDNTTPISETDTSKDQSLKTTTEEYDKIDVTTLGTTTTDNPKYKTDSPITKYVITTLTSTFINSLTSKMNTEDILTETTTLNIDDLEFANNEEDSSKYLEFEDNKEITTQASILTTDSSTDKFWPKDVTSTIKDEFDDLITTSSSSVENNDEFLDIDDSTTNIIASTEDTNMYYTTIKSKNTTDDIEAASTTYYSSTNGKIDLSTQITTESMITSMSFTTQRPTTIPTTTHQESTDSREPKKTNGIDELISTLDLLDVTIGTTKGIKEFETKETDVPKHYDNSDDFTSFGFDITTVNQHDTTTTTVHPNNNIEVIDPGMPEVDNHDNEGFSYETTSTNEEDIVDSLSDAVDGSGAVAAITISVIGVIALILLIVLLLVARGRRRSGGYGQRCTPVSLDSYSLDNVSVGGSTRRKGMRRPSKRSYGNPAYDESGATSHPMQFAALTNFSLDQESVINEFNEIPTVTVKADEVPQGCESKNRYANVVPLPETRVNLKLVSGDETSDYINANYVRGPKSMKNYYIACQAPLPSTVNDFWRMIWEQNSRVILMLTELMENGIDKCVEYIPSSEVSDNKRIFSDFQVTLTKREVRDKYAISILQLKSLSGNVWREVTHMWYFWPAKGVPDECHSIIAFLIEARSYLKASQFSKEFDENGHEILTNQNGSTQTNITIDPDDNSNGENDVNIYNVQKAENKIKNGGAKNGFNDSQERRKKGGPLVVHCSPGTGRTGTLIACDIGIRDFEMSRTVDVPKTVYKIRRDRANAVQTKDQYIFIYKVLSEYATKLTGGILDSI